MTSTDKMREQFEVHYPVPDGVCWNAEEGRYVLFHRKRCTAPKYERFVEIWECWQASRQAVVVELPKPGQPDGEHDAAWHYTRNGTIDACKRAVEAQGLRVKP